MGISHSELFPGFNRCMAEWKSPLIRSIVPEPDHRHSAQRQQRAHNVSAFCTSWMQGDTLGKSEMMILSKSLIKPITNLCSQLNIAPPTLFSIWQMIISSKWIWPSFRNEDLHLRDKAIRLSASCHSPWWMTSCRKPNTTTTDFRKQVPELSFWNDKWLSLRNDLWLSFREPSRFYRTKSDRNGSETRAESRDKQGIIPRVKIESARNESKSTPFDSGWIMPCGQSF